MIERAAPIIWRNIEVGTQLGASLEGTLGLESHCRMWTHDAESAQARRR